jgi:hypothetical protein
MGNDHHEPRSLRELWKVMPHISATTDAAAARELQSAGFDLLTGKRYEKGEI